MKYYILKFINLNSHEMKNYNHNLIIPDNDVYITQELGNYNASGHIWGISAIDCEGVSIGENTIVCDYDTGNGVPLPGDTVNNVVVNTDKTVGIWIDNCQDAMVGCNETHFFGQGIHLEGDVSGTTNPNAPHNYSNNTMASCYDGLFLEVGVIADNFGSPSSVGGYAVDNSWPASALPGPTIPFNANVLDNRSPFSNPAPTQIKYYYSSSSFDPGINTLLFTRLLDGLPNSCLITSPPAQKTNGNKQNAELTEIRVYPNPVESILHFESSSEKSTLTITGLTNFIGQKISIQSRVSGNSINVADLAKGIYLLHLSIDNKTEIIRFVKE